MHQRKIKRKSAVSWVLKVRFLFCKAQQIRTNVVFPFQVQLFYEIEVQLFVVSVPKCPSK